MFYGEAETATIDSANNLRQTLKVTVFGRNIVRLLKERAIPRTTPITAPLNSHSVDRVLSSVQKDSEYLPHGTTVGYRRLRFWRGGEGGRELCLDVSWGRRRHEEI